jgi:hypothetical protein
MERIIEWLRTKFSQPTSAIATDQPSSAASKDVLMPDIYADTHVDVEADLKALDQPTPDIEEPDGFNPYDTAVLQKKQR